jgi:hypothetical protein
MLYLQLSDEGDDDDAVDEGLESGEPQPCTKRPGKGKASETGVSKGGVLKGPVTKDIFKKAL